MGKTGLNSKELAKFIANIAIEKNAKNVVVLELTEIDTAPSEYFVFCSCDSDAQMRAIVDEIIQKSKEFSIPKPRIEGLDSKQWVLVDFFDVVLHIMHYETRKFYAIERLWADGNFFKISSSTGKLMKVRDKAKFLSEIFMQTI